VGKTKTQESIRSIRGAPTFLSRPYVPDGLTPDEYNRIKKKEQEKLSKKDFGAFGPRFLKTGIPEGDWFLMRNLWTTGFQSNPVVKSRANPLSDTNSITPASLVLQFFTAYFLSYILVSLGFGARMVIQGPPSSSVRSSLFFMLQSLFCCSFANFPPWKLQISKCVLAGILMMPIKKLKEYSKRRYKLSRLSVMIGSLLVMVSLYCSLASMCLIQLKLQVS
jgi:hypothetical protein